MGRRKNEKYEFRFYEVPRGENVLALLGNAWVGSYGHNDTCLHFHNLLEIGYCHFGKGKLLLGEREQPYEDAMITVIPANYPHSTLSEAVDSWEFLFFDPEPLVREMFPNDPKKRIEMLYAATSQPRVMHIDEVPELASTVWQILEEYREKRPYHQGVIRNLLEIVLLELVRLRESGTAPRVKPDEALNSKFQILPALRYIDENYAQDLRAADLASQCGLSEPHFRRLFAEYINMPPMDYLNLIRIQQACSLMERKDCSMDQVAVECGFSSVSAFTRNFKKFLNTTPYQWKLQIGSGAPSPTEYRVGARRGWSSLDP